LAHSTKGTPSPGFPGSDRPEAHGFRIYFTPLSGVLFTVPSRYWFPIGRRRYLALGGGPPRFPPDTTCPAVLTQRIHDDPNAFAYGTLTRSGAPFQWASANVRSRREESADSSDAPVQPPCGSGGSLLTPHRFGLLPVRSPLLRESSLFLGVLRCFSSPGAPPINRVPSKTLGGLPHSDTPGSQAASASPGHFAAWPRPSSAADAKASTMRPSSRPLSRNHPSIRIHPKRGSRTGARSKDQKSFGRRLSEPQARCQHLSSDSRR